MNNFIGHTKQNSNSQFGIIPPSYVDKLYLMAHIFRFNNIKCNSIDGFKRVAKVHAEAVVMRTVFVPNDVLPNMSKHMAFYECINESN